MESAEFVVETIAFMPLKKCFLWVKMLLTVMTYMTTELGHWYGASQTGQKEKKNDRVQKASINGNENGYL